ncbi:putative phosphoesterase [Caldalkalibacillus uzonensis]|uniref:Phosphoesterase n=1 Tax=Caldalkalibacillus uzonensis TaxID=353224 RepID=A0ABU0CNM0_9BACI|nr:metallophosphoesterase family protein [Caldalkalibacillus uzonensis]MDQ0337486.1 putative phosphoesterase [Caldalkalibacillus uzonensis]
MKIGVVSDTHVPKRAKALPSALLKGLQGVDFIIHAGDWQSLEVYERLRRIAPVDGVAGNVDGEEIVRRFGLKKILTFGPYRIGVIHGHGGKRKETAKRAYETFAEDRVDIIIFGHSHIPYLKKRRGILLFNPGSPTDKRRQKLYSFGYLELQDKIEAKHIFFADRS